MSPAGNEEVKSELNETITEIVKLNSREKINGTGLNILTPKKL